MQFHSDFLFIFPGLGMPELSLIILLVLILFGPGKLPGVMKSLGDGVKHFKDAANGHPPEHRQVSEQSEHKPE